MKKNTLATAVAVIMFVLLVLSTAYLLRPTRAALLDYETTCSGTVDKTPGELFTVRIAFKNKGTAEGIWNITVTFEGDEWTWEGERRRLTLEPDERETLTWEGGVPTGAMEDSMARLVVYYDGEHMALDWWIHVVPGAELAIVDSKVT